MDKCMTLNSGFKMPLIGLGTFPNSCPGPAVQVALAAGYRQIDTAQIYDNETAIGEALHDIFQEGAIKREEVFVTTKLWSSFHLLSRVRPALKESLDKLQLDYVDLFLMHFPCALKETSTPFDLTLEENLEAIAIDYLDTWKAMEELADEGLVRFIGVSKFNHLQLQRLLDTCRIQPANNQIEVHPLFNSCQLVDYCLHRGVSVTAYGSLSNPDLVGRPEGRANLLDDDTVKMIALNHKKTPAQVLLRYPIQRGLATVAKSSKEQHIKDNYEVFDFMLSADDVGSLKALDCGVRLYDMAIMKKSPDWPWYTF